MIPSFVIVPDALWPVLPIGIHNSDWSEISIRFGVTPRRVQLLGGMKIALDHLFGLGCPQIWLDGSFVTGKPDPGDYEIVWDPRYVDPIPLDPVFLDFSAGTIPQKIKYLGEFFPSTYIEASSGKPFLEYFQIDTDTGARKGIIRIPNYLNAGGII
jgi:hypothetical protein